MTYAHFLQDDKKKCAMSVQIVKILNILKVCFHKAHLIQRNTLKKNLLHVGGQTSILLSTSSILTSVQF